MQTRIGDDDDLTRLRKVHLREMALSLAGHMSEALIQKSRDQGVVPTPAIRQMCADLANVCADVAMQQMAVVQSVLTVRPDDVPSHLRDGTTQQIIDHVAAPQMAERIASAMMMAGLVRPTLSIPARGGVSATFAAWGCVLRQDGPASMPNALKLEYGRGTSVFPRSEALSAEEEREAAKTALALGRGLL